MEEQVSKQPYIEVMPSTVAKYARHLMKQAVELESEGKDAEMVVFLKSQAVARYYYACYMRLNQLYRCISGKPFAENDNHYKAWDFLSDYGYEELAAEGKALRVCRNEADYNPSNGGRGACNDAYYRLTVLYKRLTEIFNLKNCHEVEEARFSEYEALRFI